MSLNALIADERAIEGLPIRLVIAFVVGVATLSIMLNMVSGIGGLAVTELDAQPDDAIVSTAPGNTVQITAVGSDGEPVSDVIVVVSEGTASLGGGSQAKRTDGNGVATFEVNPSLAANQEEGTLEIDVKAPGKSDYVDKRENAEILVMEEQPED